VERAGQSRVAFYRVGGCRLRRKHGIVAANVDCYPTRFGGVA
jgi:hypothetical protein